LLHRAARDPRPMKQACNTRAASGRERAAHVQRIEKVLEDANLKLGVVLTDLMGQSGRAVLHLHHRFMLKLHLGHIDAPDRAIATIEQEVGASLEPFRQAARLVSTMPGMSQVPSNALNAEIGIDMSRLKTPAHLLSWACLCPRNDESAGKRRSTRLRRGGQWLKTILVQAAWAAVKVKGSLPASPVSPPARATGRQEGHHRRGRLDAHRDLAHAAQRDRMARTRRRLFRSRRRQQNRHAPHSPPSTDRLHRPGDTGARLRGNVSFQS
jgi:transposase